MQHHAANQLDIEMTHAQHTLAGFTNNSKGLRQDLVEDRPLVRQTAGIGQTLLEGSGFATQLIVGERSDLLFKQLNIRNDRLVTLQLAGIGITQQELEHGKRQPNRVQPNGGSLAEGPSGLGSESSG